MQERPQGKREDDVVVSAPFGWKVAFPAKSLSTTIVVVALVGMLAYMVREHDLKVAEAIRVATEEQKKHAKKLVEQQEKLDGKMDALIYTTLLPEQDKRAIRFAMPPTLRSQLLEQERNR